MPAISKLGLGVGAIAATILGGYVAARMTKTPANKRIMYAAAINIGIGFLAFRKFPSVALGFIGAGAATMAPVLMSANAENLLDGSFFTREALPPPERDSLRTLSPTATTPDNNATAATSSTTASLRYLGNR